MLLKMSILQNNTFFILLSPKTQNHSWTKGLITEKTHRGTTRHGRTPIIRVLSVNDASPLVKIYF